MSHPHGIFMEPGVLGVIFAVMFLLAYLFIISGWRRNSTVRSYVRRADAWTGAADGAIAGVPLLEAAASINPHVIDALGRLQVHATDAPTILHYFQDHPALVTEHFIDQLKGYVAESIVGDHFAALGHHVVLATTTNQPGWDLLIDGHAFQVKSGTTSAHAALEHLDKHPDIPVILDPSGAQHLTTVDPHSIIALHDIAPVKLEAMASGSVHGIDTLAHAGVMHLPVVTIAFSSYHEIVRLAEGNTDYETAIAHVLTDAAGVGIGAAAGGKLGVTVGSFLGFHGAAIAGIAGAVLGGIGGKIAASFAKEAHLRKLHKAYAGKVQSARVTFNARVYNVRSQFVLEARRYDHDAQRALRMQSKSAATLRRNQTRALASAERRILRRAMWSRTVSRAEVRAALKDLRYDDKTTLVALIERVSTAGDRAMFQALSGYVAMYHQCDTELLQLLAARAEVLGNLEAIGRAKAAGVLEDLAAEAKAIYADCESLRSEIEVEMRKLGKTPLALPKPATT